MCLLSVFHFIVFLPEDNLIYSIYQIYVPVEQADTLTSLAESVSDTTGNQHLSVSGIPGQLITITLPHGTAGATNQLQVSYG